VPNVRGQDDQRGDAFYRAWESELMSNFTYVKLMLDTSQGVVVLKGRFRMSEDEDYFSGRTDDGEGVMVPFISVLYAVMA